MNLDKATEILSSFNKRQWSPHLYDVRDSLKLGVESLKREKSNRENPHFVIVGKLPSETPNADSP